MHLQSVMAWRSRAKVAIVIGLLGVVVVGGYAIFQQALNGLARPGCNGGGCEARFNEDAAHYEWLLHVALVVGGGIVLAGIAALRVLGKRLRELRQGTLPVATARQTSPSDRG